MSLRPLWSTDLITGQSGIRRETLSQKDNKNSNQRDRQTDRQKREEKEGKEGEEEKEGKRRILCLRKQICRIVLQMAVSRGSPRLCPYPFGFFYPLA